MGRFFLNRLRNVSLLCLTLLAVISNASAQSLILTDCQGFTRAIQNVDPGKLSKVEINVANATGAPSNGVEVTLTNSATGEVTSAVTQNGLAVFEGVPSGAFSIGTSAVDATVGTITVSGTGLGAAAATGVVVGTTVAGGGTVAVVGDEVINVVDEQDSTPDGEADDGQEDGDIGGDPTDPPITEEPPVTPDDGTGGDDQGDDGSGDDGSDDDDDDDGDQGCDECDSNDKPPTVDDDDIFTDANPLSKFS